ncbi:MAG: MBL fold metallo-hydrolase [Gemmatimonadota bacterium]|nr:MAG: MBL fold metallo-hydrolase [Gemmatimonadota bacterium]
MRFLGTGTSFGVPVVGCRCAVCNSSDPRNRRSRHCLSLEGDGPALLVDTPPELRLQLLKAGISEVGAVFLTHMHADHLHGIDDLRIFSLRAGRPVPLYVADEFAGTLRARFDYIFDEDVKQDPGSSAPEIDLQTFALGDELDIAGLRLTPLVFPHGLMNSYGFRCGSLGVIVDGKSIPDAALAVLQGIDTLVINALWWGDPHPTHFNVEEAIAAARSVAARQTYLTHLTHRLDYEELKAKLPPGIEPAYDGLVVDV